MNNVIKEKVIDEILKLLDKTVENIKEEERPDDYLNYIVKIKDGLKDFNLIDLIVIKEYIKDSLDTIEAVEKEAVKDVEPVVADEFTEDLKNSVDGDLPKTNIKEPEKDEEKEAEDVKEESQEDAEVNPEEVSEEKVVDTADEVIEKGNHLIAAIENSIDTVPDLNTITELIDIKLEIQDKIGELQVLKNNPEAQEKLEIEVKILKDKLNKFEERAMELINASVEETPETAVNSDVEPIVSDEKVEDIDEVDEEVEDVEDVEEPAEPVEDEFDEELDEEINLLAKLADIKEDVEEVIEKIDDIKEEITAEPVDDVDDVEEPVEDVEELEEDFSEDVDNLSEFNKISKEVAVDMDEEPMEMEEVEEEPFEEEDVEEEDEEEDKEKEEE